MSPFLNLTLYVIAGSVIGCLMIYTGIPAAPLLGAIIGAGLLSISGKIEIANWPLGTKTLLGIGIGTVIGTGINKDTVGQLQILWKPALIITFSLLVTGVLVALIISKLLGIEPIIAILGSAPGGTIGMSLIGAEYGVGAAVAALHAVRLITVLLLIPAFLNLMGLNNDIDVPK